MKAIEASALTKTYGTVRALQGVSFSISKGEVIGLLGPNGAGKTTLMKILTGYMQPDGGTATLHGIDVVDNPLGVQRHIGYLPESAPLYGEMTVQDYLVMMAELREIPPDKRRGMLSEAIYATGLEDYLTRPISKLSKGYRQRVGIAQAIVHRPQILILDEPTTGLDPTQIVEIRDLIQRLAKDATILLSTHILSEVEMTCERVLVIMRGHLEADAKVAELQSANAAVVAIEASATGVREALEGVRGVSSVEKLDPSADDFCKWRVTSSDAALGPALFDMLRQTSWRVAEIRSDSKTLESVFRDLAGASGETAPAGASSGGASSGASEVQR